MSYISRERQKIFMALCIISVVCAHTHVSNAENLIFFNQADILLKHLGCIGVSGFFILSGYTFSLNKRSPIEFWKHKANTLIIPWLFWSIVYYSMNFILYKKKFSLINLLFGWAGSYYIYSLILLYIIFSLVKGFQIRIFISLISLLITMFYCMFQTDWIINPYLSLFPWIHWFVLGIYLDSIIQWLKLITYCKFYVYFGTIFTLALNIFLLKCGLNYFSIYYIPVEIINLIFFYWISTRLNAINWAKIIFSKIGSQTLWIMFTNFYITIMFEKVLLLLKNGIFILLAPIITVFFLISLTDIFKSIENKYKLSTFINKILGIR